MLDTAIYHFSLEQYERLIETGVLAEDDRIELLAGKICTMTPIGPSHVFILMLLQKRFEQRFADRVLISVQSPVRLLPDSEPQPDLVLLKPPLETYRNRLPQAEDILLLIEVADSSLEYDRNEKLPIYARAEIPEVWIVNLKDKQLEVYSEPKNGRYGQLKTYEEGSEVAPRAFDESINCWG